MNRLLISRLAACFLLLLLLQSASAQSDTAKLSKKDQPYLRNIVKMNLSSLAFNNYNFTYERLISRKISVSAGYRFMPKTSLGDLKLSERVIEAIGDDDLQEDLDRITAANNTITAEIRFYTGKRPGAKGFYVGLYGRHASFSNTYLFDYSDGTRNYIIPLSGKTTGIGGGLLMGGQFALAKRIFVDLYILGAHYGRLSGDFDGPADLRQLSAADRQELEDELNNLVRFGDENVLNTRVSSTGVTGTVKGPFAGVRGLGFTIGLGL